MLYEVEATLTLKRESMAHIIGMSADKRAFTSVVKINQGIFPRTPITAHDRVGNICNINVIFPTEGDAQEFIDWLKTLNHYLEFDGDPENYYILKEVEEVVEPVDSFEFAPAEILEPDPYLEWVQPTHSGNAYQKDTVVRFGRALYISTHNNNVHMPTISGWHTYSPTGEPQPWVQPAGEHDAYKMGDIVTHNGQTWQVTETDANGNNVWEPGVFGWVTI